MIPFNEFKQKYKVNKIAIERVIRRVFARGWFILGPELAEFEKKFSSFSGNTYVVGVGNGTDAIALALRSLGVRDGDEVITTALTATPTVSAIRMTGATPVFVDVHPSTLNIDTNLIERVITKKTKVIIPVHLYGYPVDMDKVVDIAKKRHLFVLEDVAQAVGATYKGKKVGTWGDIAAYSFYPTKNLGAFGDGGAVGTNNPKLAEKVRQLRNYGEVSKYNNKIEGVNSRLDEIQAALLSWSLSRLPSWQRVRDQIAARYISELSDLTVRLPLSNDNTHRQVWHLFVIRTPKRDALARHLEKEGIATAVHYPLPVPLQEAYRFLGYKKGDFPVAEKAVKEILSLPIYPELSSRAQRKVIQAMRSFNF